MVRLTEVVEQQEIPAYRYVGEFTMKHGPSAENSVKDGGYAKMLRIENNYIYVGELYDPEVRHLLARLAELAKGDEPGDASEKEQTSLNDFSNNGEGSDDGGGAGEGSDAGEGSGTDKEGGGEAEGGTAADEPPPESGGGDEPEPEPEGATRYCDMSEEAVVARLTEFGITQVDTFSYRIPEVRFDVVHRHSDLKRVTTKTSMLRMSCCPEASVYVTDDNALVCSGCGKKVYLDFIKAPKNIKV